MEIIKHVIVGVLFVIIGIWLIIDTNKDLNNLKEETPLKPDYWGGYIAGVGVIIGGIMEMFGYWEW